MILSIPCKRLYMGTILRVKRTYAHPIVSYFTVTSRFDDITPINPKKTVI